MKRFVPILCCLGLLFAACSYIDPQADLDHNSRVWSRQAMSSYQFDYQTTGFTPNWGKHGVRITVADEVVVDVAPLDAGSDPIAPQEFASFPTIDDLFARVQQELDLGSVDVDVIYDPQLGHPIDAYFDRGEEGDGFEVSNLVVLQP